MNLQKWHEIRRVIKTGDWEEDINQAVKIFFMNNENSTEEKQNKYGKNADFERIPTVIGFLAMDRVPGGKYPDKFGFSNVLHYSVNGMERQLENSSWPFAKAFKNANLRQGDEAMVVTIGFTDEKTGDKYRYWIVEKLGQRKQVQEGGEEQLM